MVSRPNLSRALSVNMLYPYERRTCSLKYPSSSMNIARSLRLIKAIFFVDPTIGMSESETAAPLLGVERVITGPRIRFLIWKSPYPPIERKSSMRRTRRKYVKGYRDMFHQSPYSDLDDSGFSASGFLASTSRGRDPSAIPITPRSSRMSIKRAARE